jgi:hypothetical protein
MGDKTSWLPFKMKRRLIILFTLLAFNTVGQDMKNLYLDLQHTIITDLYHIKQKAEKILKIDSLNEIAIFFLSESYKQTNKTDSLAIFFDNLKKAYPNNPKSYILSATYQYKESNTNDTSSLHDLKIALTYDHNSFEANYILGITYYNLFNENINKGSSAKNRYYSYTSRYYLTRASQIKPNFIEYLKYPIIQLSYYLEDTDMVKIYNNSLQRPLTTAGNKPLDNNIWYFPFRYFVELPNNWERDSKLDIFRKTDYAKFHLDWYSNQLYALKEPIIYNQNNKTIYRFTWLRSFHNPIAIRIEKQNDIYKLYWKVADGYGGNDPGKLVIDTFKLITKEKLNELLSLLKSANFWNLPTLEENNGIDGAEWIIEVIENGEYHIVSRWSPRKNDFYKCGIYLIELTGLKIPEEDIY